MDQSDTRAPKPSLWQRFRGLILIAGGVVVLLVLLVIFWRPLMDAIGGNDTCQADCLASKASWPTGGSWGTFTFDMNIVTDPLREDPCSADQRGYIRQQYESNPCLRYESARPMMGAEAGCNPDISQPKYYYYNVDLEIIVRYNQSNRDLLEKFNYGRTEIENFVRYRLQELPPEVYIASVECLPAIIANERAQRMLMAVEDDEDTEDIDEARLNEVAFPPEIRMIMPSEGSNETTRLESTLHTCDLADLYLTCPVETINQYLSYVVASELNQYLLKDDFPAATSKGIVPVSHGYVKEGVATVLVNLKGSPSFSLVQR